MKKIIILTITLIAFTSMVSAQNVANGEKLYNGGCGACHGIDKKIVGPALGNIQKLRNEKWLISFIKNSTEFAKTDAEAAAVIKEYNGMMMPAQPQLTDNDVKDILAYIASKSVDEPQATATTSADASTSATIQNVDEVQAANQRGLIWSVLFGLGAFVLITWILVERIKLANYPEK